MNENLNFSPNALVVLKKRYLLKDEKGKVVETPYQMVERVARAIANVEKKYGASEDSIKEIEKSFFNMIANLEFMPNSPTLMNAGRELGQLSACFVVPVEDSMESIFDAIKSTALIHKTGGGTGFNFSNLRPKNSVVKTTGGVASGPVSFMKVFDAATQAVKQGGTRRGANMGILRIDHPDILEFIKCKEKEGEISNFNISISVTDDFMEKAFKNEDYNLIDPHTKEVVGKLNAKEVFHLLCQYAHKNGEPGVIFIDRINQFNPLPHLGKIEATNPCGEQPLLPYESCNLGSINLARMVKRVNNHFEIDWDKLKVITKLAVRFLDNVIEANKFPLSEIKEKTLATRKIGLGVMGWATMLEYLFIPYDSEEAIELAKRVMSFIYNSALESSQDLSKKRGTFPRYEGSIWHKKGIKVRNATLTTIAPTGTISIIAGPTSTGIEPNFALCYYRNVLDGEKLIEVDPAFERVAREEGFYSEDLMKKIAQGESIQNMKEIPDDVKRVFKTALEISWRWHIEMQAAFQKYTDNAVSKTINLPNNATIEDVENAYILAYKSGCKGITVYRDGSREVQVLNVEKKDTQKVKSEEKRESINVHPKPRPEVIVGTTTKVTTGCGNLYITVNQDEKGQFFEVFTQMGKAGGCAASQLEAIGRLISLALRGGINIKVIVEQLKGIRCPSPSWTEGKKIFSCADAIASVLEKRAIDQPKMFNISINKVEDRKDKEDKEEEEKLEKISLRSKKSNIIGVCPDCGFVMRHQEGCTVCDSCGFSKC